jgi:hypothetical protein
VLGWSTQRRAQARHGRVLTANGRGSGPFLARPAAFIAKDPMSEFDVHERDACNSHGRMRNPGSPPPFGTHSAIIEDPIAGDLAFANAEARRLRSDDFALRGSFVVRLEVIEASARGRLGDVIDEAIERELSARGCAAPGVGAACERESSLGDQLFRARRSGAKAICIALGPLHAVRAPGGALETEDSSTLRFFAAATRERPIILLLDESDTQTPAFADPLPLARLLGRHDSESPSAPANTGETASVARDPVAAPTVPPLHAAIAAEPLVRAPHPHRQSVGASVADPNAPWRSWTLKLVAARGPQRSPRKRSRRRPG